jgi:hypothetical protein
MNRILCKPVCNSKLAAFSINSHEVSIHLPHSLAVRESISNGVCVALGVEKVENPWRRADCMGRAIALPRALLLLTRCNLPQRANT